MQLDRRWLVLGAAVLGLGNPLPAQGPSAAENPAVAAAPSGKEEPARRPRVLVIKPVIVCDDDGTHPARSALPKTLADQAYTRAGLEFLYLEPVRWNHGKGRRGEINLDQLVEQGRKQRIICADPRVVTMVFVSTVNGHRGPLGRGMQNDNVCFVSLGEGEVADDPARCAFVVARAIGQCLGLRHAVDDPAVPADVPNLEGDGPFAERLAVAGLHPGQCATILNSPLVIDRVKCYTPAEARAALLDESWEPYLSGSTPDGLRFTLGLDGDADVPMAPADRMAFARKEHAAMAAEFTPKEEAALRRCVARLVELTGKEWPMLARLPWHYVKATRGFCSDLPHTRGMFTVLTEKALAGIVANEDFAMMVLFHEKIHILQRLNPGRFVDIYHKIGYLPLRLAGGEAERLNLIQNPDALRNDWAIRVDGKELLIAASFVRKDDGSLGFSEKYYHLEALADGSRRIDGEVEDLDKVTASKSHLRVRTGYDHPNEVFAYICGDFLPSERRPFRDIPDPEGFRAATRKQLPVIFRIDGD